MPLVAQGVHLLPGFAVVGPYGVGDLAQVAHALRRDDDGFGRRDFALGLRQPGFKAHAGLGRHGVDHGVIQRRHAVVVEFGSDGAEDRHFLRLLVEGLAVALDLLAHVLHGVVAAALFELVDHHQVGKIQHVDFFELRGGPVFAGHDVYRDVDEVHDARIALADAGGLGDDEIEARGLDRQHRVRQHLRYLGRRPAGGERAHVDPRAADGVHADAVAQQGAAGLAARGIAAQHRHPHVVEVVQDAHDELVGQGGLAGAAGARDAHHRRLAVADLAGEIPQRR